MKHKTIKKHQQQATKTQKNSQKRNETETIQKRNDKNAKTQKRKKIQKGMSPENAKKNTEGNVTLPPSPPRLKTGGGKVKRQSV